MWSHKSKQPASTPTYKGKVATNIERGDIVTPDRLQILVGADEDLVLIYQEETSLWASAKTKTPLV